MNDENWQERPIRDAVLDDKLMKRLLSWRHVRARCEQDESTFNGLLLEDIRADDAAFDALTAKT